MILISKINIEYYRSLKKTSIKNVNHLNIFSGKNDIGKSNVLKALDTFFNKKEINFFDDFNKERLSEVRQQSIKGKQFIKITIEFKNPGSYKTLPNRFSISKTWDRNGHIIEGIKDNLETNFGNKIKNYKIETARRSLTLFLNKIRFTYIPAIRDERFFSYLLNILQETIFAVEERKRSKTFQTNIQHFNRTISELTSALNEEFKRVSGISSSLSFPNNVSEIFQRLIIDTKSGMFDVPLRLRGDGIRLRYIPTILNYISNFSRFYEIWGFDEPENSCEYSLSQKIAHEFANDYSIKSQIFVASHSFHFISLDNPRTSKYRVYKSDEDANSNIALINDTNNLLLSDELGVLEINKELLNLYEKLSSKMRNIENLESELENTKKPYLIFEGKTDRELFELAYLKNFNKSINNEYVLAEELTTNQGSSVGMSAKHINDFMYNHISKIPIKNIVIGIFDFDMEGVGQIKGLKEFFNQIDTESDNFLMFQHKSKSNVFVITISPPDFRSNFFDKVKSQYCYLSTELLFNDSEINNSNREYPTLFDKTVFSFTGNKMTFVERIKLKQNDIDFSGFLPTFKSIEKIVKEFKQD